MQSLNSLVQIAKQGMDKLDLTAEQKERINKDLGGLLAQFRAESHRRFHELFLPDRSRD